MCQMSNIRIDPKGVEYSRLGQLARQASCPLRFVAGVAGLPAVLRCVLWRAPCLANDFIQPCRVPKGSLSRSDAFGTGK